MILSLILTLATPASSTLTQPVAPWSPGPTATRRDEIQRATAWPEFGNQAELKQCIARVRKARTEEMAVKGAGQLEEIGPAAAPLLLKFLGSEKDAEARARMEAVLDSITAPEHTRLLAEVLDERADAPRRYAARRVAELGDPGLQEASEAFLSEWTERAKDKRARKPVEALDLQLAAVLCLSTGSLEGVPGALELAAPEPWKTWGPALEGACAHAKAASEAVGAELSARLAKAGDPAGRVLLLRLFTYAGSKDQIKPIVPLLNAEQNQVKVATINALRMIVDGAAPLKRLSSFDAIEHANRWKERL
ncbi:MAG: hypothetical protein P8M11_05730 [Planctomycetota bacterium]|nr:hypothetical protein [Planctomycetota bacterium]MDG1984045.1 hypothetical protein [Planctomycetota bacterium]